MKSYHEGAYAMAALAAAVVAFRVLIKKGLITQEEAVRELLDEAVSRAIFAEGQSLAANTAEMNRQSAEILKMLAQGL